VGADTNRILAAAASITKPPSRPAVYGDGHAAEAIVAALEERFGGNR